jgi:ABC-type transport system involved in multi-copper enzyme maturation permease subunit
VTSMTLLAVSDTISNWLTPVWLLGLGAVLGLALLALLWAVLWAISRLGPLGFRRSLDEIPLALREGVLFPLLIIVGLFAVFGLLGPMFARHPAELLRSLTRLTAVGQDDYEFTIPPTPRDAEGDVDTLQETPINVNLRSSEVRRFEVESDQDLIISPVKSSLELVTRGEFRVSGGEVYQWNRSEESLAEDSEVLANMYVTNLGSQPAELTMRVYTAPRHPEVLTVPITGLAIVVIFLLYIVQRSLAPKLSAIALATFKSEVNQPLFVIIILLGAVALALFVILPYNTFGEDIKMLKDTGFVLIMVLSLIQAIWGASTSVADEVEGRTALTVLSKPIRRPSFVLGKYLGISWAVALTFIMLGALFMILVAYKPLYDGVENSKSDVTWQLCHYEMVVAVPGLLLSFMETLVIAAISVAISTRLPMLANFVICFTIYVLGNITPTLVESTSEQFEIVAFFAQLIATVLPNLENFNIQAAIAADAEVPLLYLGVALVYCALYVAIALLLALFLFEDRDLA